MNSWKNSELSELTPQDSKIKLLASAFSTFTLTFISKKIFSPFKTFYISNLNIVGSVTHSLNGVMSNLKLMARRLFIIRYHLTSITARFLNDLDLGLPTMFMQRR